MPVEKIKYDDVLRTGTDKLNQAIDIANKVEIDSATAIDTSNGAAATADEAKSKALEVEIELDAVVNRETDSDAMSRQAAVNTEGVDMLNLKARLDADHNSVTSQLAENAKNVNLYAWKQTIAINKFIDINTHNTPCTIVCQGDSLTYGKQEGTSSYPDVLSNIGNDITGNKVTVINRGYSGDNVKMSYDRWTTNPNANLHIIMLGTNDAYTGRTIEQSVNDYFNLIKRILDWGSAVVIITPPRKKAPWDAGIMAFNSSVKRIAQMMNIPCFDSAEMLEGYNGNDIFIADGVHFNDTGYYYLGCKIGTFLIGSSVLTPDVFKLKRGKHITVDAWIGNMRINATSDITAKISNKTSSLFGTGDVHNTGLMLSLNKDAQVNFAFYAEEDDLVLVPYFGMTGNANCEVQLNYRSNQPKQVTPLTEGKNLFSEVTVPSKSIGFGKGIVQKTYKTNNKFIRLTSRGLNQIYVRNVSDEASTLEFYGFYVMSYSEYMRQKQIENYGKVTASALDGVVVYPTPFADGKTNYIFTQAEQFQATDGKISVYNSSPTGFNYTVSKVGLIFYYVAKGE